MIVDINDRTYNLYWCLACYLPEVQIFIDAPTPPTCKLCGGSEQMKKLDFQFPELNALFEERKNGIKIRDNDSDEELSSHISLVNTIAKAVRKNHRVILKIKQGTVDHIIIERDLSKEKE